ncbi:unnamed protein product [Cyprideis torosa]|uniref:V-type proton ATPase subunit H n=1 Tax=Cyprideis torosa TaxID=163714 RepID=A0A7R8ZP41_9CRUS|nr:unnamed protein product [Cyprideis torosa]CAG0888999.1 unnamed protein product [Cyprideis torosa]
MAASKAVLRTEDFGAGGDKLAGTSVLQLQANEIREMSIPWSHYKESGMIPENIFQYVKSLDIVLKQGGEKPLKFVQENAKMLAPAFVFLLSHLNKDQTIQYLLVMLDDVIRLREPNVSKIFVTSAETSADLSSTSCWTPFLNLMNHREDRFIVHMSSRVLSHIAVDVASTYPMTGPDLDFFLTWLKTNLGVRDEFLQSVLRRIHMLLMVPLYRDEFLAIGGMEALGRILSPALDFQVQYQLIFCLWILSFDPNLCSLIQQKLELAPVLSEIFGSSSREKVKRISLAVLRNLIEKEDNAQRKKETCILLIHGRILKNIGHLKEKPIDDVEFEEDMNYVEEALNSVLLTLSSFDEYAAEIRSGRLEWSPVHRSPRFWIENAEKLNRRGYELLKMLIHLLDSSKNPLILSVACHDLGEYVRHYTPGKQVLEALGGKHLIMQCLAHGDPGVRYEALISLQKLMVHNWDYLGKKLPQVTSADAPVSA